ncbi:MAG: cell division protein DivIC [Candidatus Azotimanducaceae bacterium]|jgi:cell division protein DivIC
MLFFDSNNWLTHLDINREVRELDEAKTHFQEDMEADKKALEELSDDPEKIEKYAREKFLMKRKQEDVYIIQKKEP